MDYNTLSLAFKCVLGIGDMTHQVTVIRLAEWRKNGALERLIASCQHLDQAKGERSLCLSISSDRVIDSKTQEQ